jgi:hypothetical protein
MPEMQNSENTKNAMTGLKARSIDSFTQRRRFGIHTLVENIERLLQMLFYFAAKI